MEELPAEQNPNPPGEAPRAGKSPLPNVAQTETQLSEEYTAAYADIPAREPSGGDFHNAFLLNDGSGDVAVLMGDISGHGPEQTAQAELMRGILSDCLSLGIPPAKTLETVNAMVEIDPNLEDFSTVFAGKLEADTGKLTYASGGHEPALIAPADADSAEQVRELKSTGPPVGILPPSLTHFHQGEETLPEGSTMLLYTDGISDAHPPYNRRAWLGIERLKTVLVRFASLPPGRLISRLLKWVISFCHGQFRDDVAVMAIRRKSASVSEDAGPSKQGKER